MAKPIKHSDRDKIPFPKNRSRSRNELGRKSPTRIPRRSILIVCEGEKTEPDYFKGLRKKYRLSTLEVEIAGEECGSDPNSVVRYACNRKNDEPDPDFDEVWCIIDVESYDNPRDLTGPLNTASENNIKVALSNPCFEVWLLYHFERVGRAFDDCRDVISRLKTHIPNYTKGGDYFKDHFSDKVDDAIDHAESIMNTQWQLATNRLQNNPSTEVYRLVQLIQENVNSR